jgi:hypothetical protein
MKTFKEYSLMTRGYAIGGVDNAHPIASLGDVPPKGKGSRSSRAVGLTAQNNIKEKIGFVVRYTDSKNKKFATAFKMKKDAEDKLNQFKKSGMKDVSITTHKINYSNQINFRGLDKPLSLEDTNRIPRKPGQKSGSDKHSDLYTDENPKGTIHGLGFTDRVKATQSINKIKGSGKTHAHKMQAAIAMSQRAKVASQRAKDPEKKKDLASAHRTYQQYINQNKKSKD